MGAKQIIEGLEDAVKGNISYVYINGQHWKRVVDEEMPVNELRLHELQNKIAELTTELDVKQAEIDRLLKLNDVQAGNIKAFRECNDELNVENAAMKTALGLANQMLAECKDQLQKNIAILTDVREALAVKAL